MENEVKEESTFWDNTEIKEESLTDEDKKMIDLLGADSDTIEESYLNEELNKAKDLLNDDIVNIYTNVFGTEYSARLSEIFHASILEQRDKMKAFYEDINKDEKIDDNAKKIATAMMISYNFAIFEDKYSGPIFSYFIKHTNVKKYVSDVRLNRISQDLKTFMERTGFKFNTDILGALAKILYTKYNYNTSGKELEKVMFYPMVVIARYTNRIHLTDYANIWYILIFMINIANMALLDTDQIKENDHLFDLQKNLVRFLLYIWKKGDPDTFTGPMPMLDPVKVEDVDNTTPNLDTETAPVPDFSEKENTSE